MDPIESEELERKLREVRLKTSPGLDARVKKLGERLGRGSRVAEETVPRTRRRLFARLGKMAGVAAAVLVAVLVVWWLIERHKLEPSAYAQLLQAAENSKAAEWVHMQRTVASEEEEVQMEAWASLQSAWSFQKLGERIEAFDFQSHRRYIYDPATRTITIDYLALGSEDENRLKKARNYYEFWLMALERAKEQGIEVIRSEEVIDGKTCIVFTLTEAAKGIQSRVVVDAQVQRIIRMESESPTESVAINLDYPETGPADIYALGVPRDARIVDKTPPEELKNLKEKIEAARKRFAPTYYAIIYRGRVWPEGGYHPDEIHVVYKKNGRYRIERYLTEGGSAEELRRRIPAEDMSALEAWTKKRPVREVYFLRLDEGGGGETRVWLDNDGGLQKKVDGWGAQQFILERYSWGLSLAMSDSTILPSKDGRWGPLIGSEHTTQGITKKRQIVFFPAKTQRYFNPSRDYINEQYQHLEDAQASWQQDKDWLKDVDPDSVEREWGLSYSEIKERRSLRSQKVLEYAKTAEGQWYAKKILSEFKTNRFDDPSKSIVIIHLDTSRDIPDALLDPESIDSPAIFAPYNGWEGNFNKAIGIIDSREHWPGTPEEVAKTYWEARNAKQYDEMEILWPGSGSFNWSEICKHEKFVKYVFGKARKDPHSQYVFVPYAAEGYYDEHGTYNLKMVLSNQRSSKGRYYVVSGN